MSRKIPDEVVKQARQVNLVDFLKSRGVALKRVGNGEYIHPDHDSLAISGNHFNWFSRGMVGDNDSQNAITLVMELYDLTFKEAVAELVGFTPSETYEPEPEYKPYKPDVHTDAKRVIAYLCKTRGLDYQIVARLLREGKLRQDTHGNAAFFRPNGSAELHGTGQKRYKGQYQEQEGFGFEFPVGSSFRWVIYTESAIDAISLYQLNRDKLHNSLIVSMSGLKPVVVETYSQKYPAAMHVLAVDNDDKGNEFCENIKNEFPKIRKKQPDGVKDWNEKLKLQG
jgi:hypothetical protein